MSRIRTVDALLVRLARAVLIRAVRGRAARGTDWGEALLGEFEEAPTAGAALRWTLSSVPVAWRQRRHRASAARPGQPLRVRVTRRVLVTAVIVVAAGFLVNAFVATIVYEPSASMAPTVAIGGRVLVDKVGFHVTGLHRGDLVLVDSPELFNGEGSVLRRVVGLAGDRMSCADGRLYANGTPVPGDRSKPSDPSWTCADIVVPVGDVYLAGDNRYVSKDSTRFGPVPRSAVSGRVVLVLWR